MDGRGGTSVRAARAPVERDARLVATGEFGHGVNEMNV